MAQKSTGKKTAAPMAAKAATPPTAARARPFTPGQDIPGRRPRRTKTGRVMSNKMEKTVVVAVEQLAVHRLYGRTVRRTISFKAHDEKNECIIGDTVVIAESRPISKDKHWVVRAVLRKGTGEPIEIIEVEA